MTTQRFDPDAFAPVDGYSLEMYAAVCRALVRVPAGSTRQVEAALAEHALTASRWAAIRSAWSARIAADPFVRGVFRRLYVGDAELLADAGVPADAGTRGSEIQEEGA